MAWYGRVRCLAQAPSAQEDVGHVSVVVDGVLGA